MESFGQIIKENNDRLNEKTESSDELKRVLGYVTKISNKKLSMELKIHSMTEKIHFLRLHNYLGLDKVIEKYEKLKISWEKLRIKAKKKDDNLLERKKNLAANTEKDAEILNKEVEEEYKKYKKAGPLTDVTLKEGYEILQNSKESLKILKQKKEDIVGSQKLFNLPITTFPEINEMIEENTRIEPIYNTYHEFEEFYTKQKLTTWAKLETSVLEKKNKELKQAKDSFVRKN